MNVQSAKDILTALVGYDTTSRNSNLDLIAVDQAEIHGRVCELVSKLYSFPRVRGLR